MGKTTPSTRDVLEFIDPVDALDLVQRVHREVEFDGLIDLLLAYASGIAPVVGIRYVHRDIEIAAGRSGEHSITYDLEDDTGELGTLMLTSQKPFAEAHGRRLEDLLALTMSAVRNAQRFRQAGQTESGAPKRSEGTRRRNDAIILLALERFDEVQSRVGIAAAQAFINDLSDFLRAHLRAADDVYQIDDGEIAILLPHTGESNAGTLAEKLHGLIVDHADLLAIDGEHVTPILGVASTHDAGSAEEVLGRARNALNPISAEDPVVLH